MTDIDNDKWIDVKWDNGLMKKYRVGTEDGKFDLALSPNAIAIRKLSTPGTKVVPGPDWDYENQLALFSARELIGSVVWPEAGKPGWVEVQWDGLDFQTSHRIGADQGKFDIVPFD